MQPLNFWPVKLFEIYTFAHFRNFPSQVFTFYTETASYIVGGVGALRNTYLHLTYEVLLLRQLYRLQSYASTRSPYFATFC